MNILENALRLLGTGFEPTLLPRTLSRSLLSPSNNLYRLFLSTVCLYLRASMRQWSSSSSLPPSARTHTRAREHTHTHSLSLSLSLITLSLLALSGPSGLLSNLDVVSQKIDRILQGMRRLRLSLLLLLLFFDSLIFLTRERRLQRLGFSRKIRMKEELDATTVNNQWVLSFPFEKDKSQRDEEEE